MTIILALDIIGVLCIIFLPVLFIVWLFYKFKEKRYAKKIPDKIKQEVENVRKEKERRRDEAAREYGKPSAASVAKEGRDIIGSRENKATAAIGDAGRKAEAIPARDAAAVRTAGAKDRGSLQVLPASRDEKPKRVFTLHKPGFIRSS